ncbi:helix-turn-helix domain-containing protein [Weissella minor]|nr:helix-turn-helix domain-containing protein [Weissella minor]
MIDLNVENIMSSKEATKLWGKADDYVRQMLKKYPQKFPEGSVCKFGRQLVVTTEGMEAVTGVKNDELK